MTKLNVLWLLMRYRLINLVLCVHGCTPHNSTIIPYKILSIWCRFNMIQWKFGSIVYTCFSIKCFHFIKSPSKVSGFKGCDSVEKFSIVPSEKNIHSES